MSKAMKDITTERESQIEKGWTHEHDDGHPIGHLVNRAIVYASAGRYEGVLEPALLREQLVKGAAMLVAAIDRVDRAADVEIERKS